VILDEPLRPACAAAKTLHADDGAPFEAPQGSSSIENWKVGEYVSLGFCRRHTRSELVLFGVAFTGSGERAIHLTHQHASPAAARTSARRNSLRSHPLPYTLSARSHVPSAGAVRCAKRSRGEAANGSASPHQPVLQVSVLDERLSRSARRSKLVDRCGPHAAPVCRQASARPARGSLGGSTAAAAAASAAPPSVAAGRAAQLASGGFGGLQRTPMRSRSFGWPRTHGAQPRRPRERRGALFLHFPSACE
jgi:hypothetical protein